MMRADALNLDNYPAIIEVTGVKHIRILHVCFKDDSKSKELLVDKNLLQVCDTEKDE